MGSHQFAVRFIWAVPAKEVRIVGSRIVGATGEELISALSDSAATTDQVSTPFLSLPACHRRNRK
jgi:hypothetical protein